MMSMMAREPRETLEVRLPNVLQPLAYRDRTGRYSLTVLTATACNLGCGYCFENIAADPPVPGAADPPTTRHAAPSGHGHRFCPDGCRLRPLSSVGPVNRPR